MSDFDTLVNYALNLDPLIQVFIISLVGCLLALTLARLITRRGRKRSSEPEKIVKPFKLDEQFDIDQLNQEVNRLTANIQSEPSIEEKQVALEVTTEINYEDKYNALEKSYMTLEVAFASLKTRIDNWKQRCLRAEEINEGYGTDVSAIYKSKGDIKVAALEFMLSLVADTNSIEQGIKTINKPAYPQSLQVGSYIVGLAIVAFFWLNKEAWGNMMQFINTPRNQIFIAIALVALAVITYYYKRKR